MAEDKGPSQLAPRVRVLVATAGVILIGIGVYATFHAEQDAATATTVAGGIILLLVAAVGGLLRLKYGDLELVFSEAAEGNKELADQVLQFLFRQFNPDAEQYRQQVLAALQLAAAELGVKVNPLSGVVGLDAVVAGSLVGVDIRAGPRFALDRVQTTYAALLDPRLPVVDGMMAIIRTDPNNPSVRALPTLKQSLGGPIEVVAWRPGDSHELIRPQLQRVLAQVRDHAEAAEAGVAVSPAREVRAGEYVDLDELPEGVEEAPARFGGSYLYQARELLVANDRIEDLFEVLDALRIRREREVMPIGGLPLSRVLLSPDEPRTVPEVVSLVRAFEQHGVEEAEHRDFSRLVFPVTVVCGTPLPNVHVAAPPRPTEPLPDRAEDGDLPGTNVRVAVLDSGVVEGHRWLDAHRIDRRRQDVEMPEFDGRGRLARYSGHGTFVAGMVLQHAPGATVVARKIFGGDGFVSDLDLAAALLDLPDVELINLSLGGPTHDDIGLPATEAALQRLFARELVPLVVAAAGNGYSDRPYYPAAFKRVVAVGALHAPRQRACFSNYGSWVDACAPGVGLRSTFLLRVDARTTPPTPPNCLEFVHDPNETFWFDGWAKWSGTSFSTAVVAGSIAATLRPGTDPTEAAFRLVGAAALPRLLAEGLGTIVDSVRDS